MDVLLSWLGVLKLVAKITDKQDVFFRYLEHVQQLSVETVMMENKSNDDIEKLLYSVSYEAIYRVLELIDGYAPAELRVDLVDKDTGISICENIELHDKCVDYLRTK